MNIKNLASDIKISPLIFGGNVFGWTIDDKQSHALIHEFLHLGFNAIDTADMYSSWVPGNSGGESEQIIGSFIAQNKKRHSLVIATKLGLPMNGRQGLKKENIIKCCEDSLRRLKTDYIDLYQAHTDDSETPLEETLLAFEELLKQGKIRSYGASNYSGDRFKSSFQAAQSLGISGYKTLQPKYNLFDRKDFETDHREFCLNQSISVIPYYSLAAGFLTGKYRQASDALKSPRGQMVVSQYLNDPRAPKVLEALDLLAKLHNKTCSQISLAWLLHQKVVTAPIVSATSIEQLKEILKSVEVNLDAQSLSLLDEASLDQSAKK